MEIAAPRPFLMGDGSQRRRLRAGTGARPYDYGPVAESP